MLRLEDPIEDSFCNVIATNEGNFRIIPGRWEAAAAYTQTLLEAFCDLPEGSQKTDALRAIYALLRVSDEICERSGLERETKSGGETMGEIRLPSKEALSKLSRRVRFSNSDLDQLRIEPGWLHSFHIREEYFPYLSDRPIGDTPLEFYPLLPTADGFDVISPPNISLAVRAALISVANTGGLGDLLQRRLLEKQERFSEVTGFWPRASIELSPPNSHNLRASVCKYDHGHYLHILQIPTLFDGFPEMGFGSFRRMPTTTEEFIAKEIERFWKFVEQQGDCRRSTTVLLLSGWGAPHGVVPPINEVSVPSHWQFLPMSFADAAVLGACDNGKFRDVLRLTEQSSRLETDGFTLMNPNGLLNLFGFWRATEGNLVPEHLWDMVPPCELILDVGEILTPRLEALHRQDRRALPLPEGGYKVVQRKDWGDDELSSIHASVEDIAQDRLAGAVSFADRTIWIESAATQTVTRHWQYQVWNAILQWLCVVGPKVVEAHPALFPAGSYRISISLPDNDGFDGVKVGSHNELPLCDCLVVQTQATDNGCPSVQIKEGWSTYLTATQNDAEVELIAAVFEVTADQDHRDCARSNIVGFVRTAIGSADWRWLHAQEADDPLPRLAARGLIASFKPISFSAHALVKYGSVWSFRNRELGSDVAGEESCRAFLKTYRDAMLESLMANVRRFDRQALVVAAARSFQAARCEQYRWQSTIRALRAIHGHSADATAFKRQNEINAVIRASKSICEIAACEAAPVSGITPARAEIEEMYAKALLLFGNGQLFAAIRGGLIAPTLRISPGGDVLSEREIFSRLLEPGAAWLHSRALNASDERYGSSRRQNNEPVPEKLGWDEGLRAAVEAEYGVSAEGYIDFQFAVVQLAEGKRKDVFVAKHSELLDALKKNPAYPDVDPSGLLKRLTLKCRSSWQADLSEAEIDLSRFDRRLSLINRPLLAIDDKDDPTVLVAPAFVLDSVRYSVSGLHQGALNNSYWDASEARRYAGARGDAAGHRFEEKVASKLRETGLEALTGCKLSKLLNQKVSDELGNIDVFAMTKDRKRAWVIEAKDLRVCRTESEVAARLSEYRGRTNKDSKGRDQPDKLMRHIKRVQYLRDRSAALAKTLKLAQPPEIKGLLVVDAPQPMNFHMLEDVPDAASAFLDAISDFKF